MELTAYEQFNDTPWVDVDIVYDKGEDSFIPRECVKRFRMNTFVAKGGRILVVDTIDYDDIQYRKMIVLGKVKVKTLHRRTVVVTSTVDDTQTNIEFEFSDDMCAFGFQTKLVLLGL